MNASSGGYLDDKRGWGILFGDVRKKARFMTVIGGTMSFGKRYTYAAMKIMAMLSMITEDDQMIYHF